MIAVRLKCSEDMKELNMSKIEDNSKEIIMKGIEDLEKINEINKINIKKNDEHSKEKLENKKFQKLTCLVKNDDPKNSILSELDCFSKNKSSFAEKKNCIKNNLVFKNKILELIKNGEKDKNIWFDQNENSHNFVKRSDITEKKKPNYVYDIGKNKRNETLKKYKDSIFKDLQKEIKNNSNKNNKKKVVLKMLHNKLNNFELDKFNDYKYINSSKSIVFEKEKNTELKSTRDNNFKKNFIEHYDEKNILNYKQLQYKNKEVKRKNKKENIKRNKSHIFSYFYKSNPSKFSKYDKNVFPKSMSDYIKENINEKNGVDIKEKTYTMNDQTGSEGKKKDKRNKRDEIRSDIGKEDKNINIENNKDINKKKKKKNFKNERGQRKKEEEEEEEEEKNEDEDEEEEEEEKENEEEEKKEDEEEEEEEEKKVKEKEKENEKEKLQNSVELVDEKKKKKTKGKLNKKKNFILINIKKVKNYKNNHYISKIVNSSYYLKKNCDKKFSEHRFT
ncbi:hypothetical protein PGAL8A_00506400 [Plasmodium gallinaceum]|uniref:Uncharacterized protein n=1 Tax=Plasmodium gallinaceum TaxID=5849 RepID=A0A1J1H1T2_PLAGA|nr:hypothetical protein PGAL8A_00506400 [Plasmodium gallinaceum]CRG97491.1 hypothetical protein PGAL8A_00506400 [Plasmodium gallinaceum]